GKRGDPAVRRPEIRALHLAGEPVPAGRLRAVAPALPWLAAQPPCGAVLPLPFPAAPDDPDFRGPAGDDFLAHLPGAAVQGSDLPLSHLVAGCAHGRTDRHGGGAGRDQARDLRVLAV